MPALSLWIQRPVKILAMANRPSYDPNNYNQSGEEAFKNIAVTNLYEPGSTFKPIIASAALAAGKWKLDTVYNDKRGLR